MDSIEIIVGTYENVVLGFKTIPPKSGKTTHSLETSFTDDSHGGALRCLSVSASGILASSSTDDTVRLLSLKKRRDIGGLFQHSGTVNCILFYSQGFMFTASDDGTICMWKSKNWEVLKALKAHKAKVLSVTIHPSGKLALSVGSDRSLITWDLLTGKCAFQRKINQVAETIHFSPSGDHYILQYPQKLEICAIKDTKTVNEIPTEWRINSLALLKQKYVLVGGEDRHVIVVDLFSGDVVLSIDVAGGAEEFNSRIKGIHIVEEEANKSLILVGTAAGAVKGFQLDLSKGKRTSQLVLSHETGVRLTCITAYRPQSHTQATVSSDKPNKIPKKKPSEEVQGDGDDSSEDEEESEEEEPPMKKKKKAQNGKTEKLKKSVKSQKEASDDESSEEEEESEEELETEEEDMESDDEEIENNEEAGLESYDEVESEEEEEDTEDEEEESEEEEVESEEEKPPVKKKKNVLNGKKGKHKKKSEDEKESEEEQPPKKKNRNLQNGKKEKQISSPMLHTKKQKSKKSPLVSSPETVVTK